MELNNKPSIHRRSAAEIKSILTEQANSHLSVNDFCSAQKISRALFYHWRKKYTDKDVQTGFMPVHLSNNERTPEIFAEIEFQNQYSVRLFRPVEPAYIKALLKP